MVTKKIVAQAIIQKATQDYEDEDVKIMTSMLDGYERPEPIMRKQEQEDGFVPDVMLRTDKVTELYEIDLAHDFKLEKWKLFSLFSKNANRSFNIVTPEEHVNPLRTFLKQNNIRAQILYFS